MASVDNKIPRPFANALRSDAERLESRAGELAAMAINLAGNPGADMLLSLAGEMRELAATVRTVADFTDMIAVSVKPD